MKNKEQLLRTLIVVGVTMLIIAFGILVPYGLLALKSTAKNLPKGMVDTENIQPYGADVIRIENSMINASKRLYDEGYPQSQITTTWTATINNRYSEIGIQSRLYEEGIVHNTEEFLYSLDAIIRNSFGGDVGIGETVLVSSTTEINDEGAPIYFISAQDNNTKIYLDGNTGIPIMAEITIISPNRIDRANLRSDIVRLYQQTSGMDFVYVDSNPGYIEDYDSYYRYDIENTDQKIRLTVVITSGWYWLPPDSESEDWKPTDNYIWEIQIYCNNPDIPEPNLPKEL